jgi:hypothetical protein
MGKDKFKSLPEVISEMPDEKRERLAASVNVVIADLGLKDVASLRQILKQSSEVKDAVLKSVREFFEKEMQLQLAY